MSYQEKLVNYMKAKVDALPGKPFHYLFTEADQADLLGWSDEDAKQIVLKLKEALKKSARGIYVVDVNLCPWCLLYYATCRTCSFGKRHNNGPIILTPTIGPYYH